MVPTMKTASYFRSFKAISDIEDSRAPTGIVQLYCYKDHTMAERPECHKTQ